MMLAPEHVPHSRAVHFPFQKEPRHHLKRNSAADNRRLSLLGIGVADAGNAGGTEHNPPAVLTGYGSAEHAERECRRDDEVAPGPSLFKILDVCGFRSMVVVTPWGDNAERCEPMNVRLATEQGVERPSA